jgi:hypothetical protein
VLFLIKKGVKFAPSERKKGVICVQVYLPMEDAKLGTYHILNSEANEKCFPAKTLRHICYICVTDFTSEWSEKA